MRDVKVTVIIPVYNTERYVGEAIGSIINQTLQDIEIIIVNDGSTDNSLKIAKQCACSDDRIRVLSQDNQGQSVARNLGLRYASGEFIYFMDSDDLLSEDTLMECYNKCRKDRLDLVFFDGEIFYNHKGGNLSNVSYKRTHLIEDTIYSGPEALQKLLQTGGFSASPCLYLIKYSFLKKIKLGFYPGIIHEDELFTFQLYAYAERIGLIAKPYFRRRVRGNSTMTSEFSISNVDGYYRVAVELKRLCSDEKNNVLSSLIDMRLRMIVEGVFYSSRSLNYAERLYVFFKFFLRFCRYLSYKSILLIIFPFLHLFPKYAK